MYFQVSEIMDPEAGHVHRDGVVLACEVLECCPWFEFADLDVYGNTTEEEADDLSTDPDELLELGMLAVTYMANVHSHRSATKVPSLQSPTRCLLSAPQQKVVKLVIWQSRATMTAAVACLLSDCAADSNLSVCLMMASALQRMVTPYHLRQMRSCSTACWPRLACI